MNVRSYYSIIYFHQYWLNMVLNRRHKEMVSVVNNYRNHLKSVYELEAFYGEPTLETLLKHSVELSDVLEEFEEIYELSREDEEQEEDNFDDDDEPTSEEEAPPALKIPSKTVLH